MLNLKFLHLMKYFYTGTAHGARDKYRVCSLQTSLRVRTPTFSCFLCGRLPSPALASAAPPVCLKHRATAVFDKYISQFFLFNQCSCLEEMPRRQNARLHCFQRMARFFNGVKQLTANVDRENIQVQRKCAQTLFSASHNFPSTQMQQKRAARDQIHNNSVSCDRQFLETVQLSIKRNLHNPQSRVRQFYDSARRKTWKSVLIYSVTVLYSVIQC